MIVEGKNGGWLFRHDDGFARGYEDVPIGSPACERHAKRTYSRSAWETVAEAIQYCCRDLGFDLERSFRILPKFHAWLHEQDEFSKEWYLCIIYEDFAALNRHHRYLFDNVELLSLEIFDLYMSFMNLGALCREYELSREHKDDVLVRRKSVRALNAPRVRREVNEERRRAAEHWWAIARGIAATSKLRGQGLEGKILKALEEADVDPLPKGRTIRAAIKGVEKSPK